MFKWFFPVNKTFIIFFAIATMIVGLMAYSLYRLSQKKELKLFSTAFFLFSSSYIIQTIINFFIITRIGSAFRPMARKIMPALIDLAVISEAILFSIGLSIIAYITFKTDQKRIFYLIMSLVTVSLLLSSNIFYSYNLIAIILLSIIVYNYYKTYSENKKKGTLLSMLAFIFLLIGYLSFIFALHHPIFNLAGSILEFAAYLLIITNLIIINKK